MKKNILLNNLDSISNFQIYSKKNSEYEKVLGNYTLKSFIQSLNNPIKIKKKKFLDEMAEKYPYEENSSNLISHSISKRKTRSKELFNGLINNYTQTEDNQKEIKSPSITYNYRKPIQIDLTPNPCTYNPKYDCIFKRIPVVTIYKTYKTPRAMNNNNNINISIKRIKLKKIKKENINNNIILYRNNKEKKNVKNVDTLKLFNKKLGTFLNNNNYLKEEKNDNSQYISRIAFENKNIIKKVKNNEYKKKDISDVFNIIHKNKTPQNNVNNFNKNKRKNNYFFKNFFKTNAINEINEDSHNKQTKNIIDFNKMTKRNFDIILNKSTLKNPSFYRYNPKFGYITQSTKGFNFGQKENKTIYEKKKTLLKKMWCSYGDLSKEYYLINNSKLNKKQDK